MSRLLKRNAPHQVQTLDKSNIRCYNTGRRNERSIPKESFSPLRKIDFQKKINTTERIKLFSGQITR
jgi:hypothetical protein